MGKRSTTSTKSGRAMNPADQARKEARRRELKKNKKQRQVVREAVIKSKDPKKVIEELERLDQMEYNIHEIPPLPEHILAERRKRLLGNFSRCLSLYEKEDKTKYADLKKLLAAYHRKHDDTRRYYESVRRAQNVNIEEITLPSLPAEDGDSSSHPQEENLSSFRLPQGPVVISAPRIPSWEALSDDLTELGGRRPPGPPCGPPPSFSDDSDDEGYGQKDAAHEGESEEDEYDEDEEADVSEAKKKEKDPAAGDHEMDTDEVAEDSTRQDESDPTQAVSEGISPEMRPPPVRPAPFNPRLPNFRNVPPPSLSNARFAQPPPRPGMPALNRMMMMRPPPGFPVHGLAPIGPIRPPMMPGDVIAQRPALYNQPVPTPESKTTIAAKPQLRNTMAEVTRLVPTAVKVKREEQIKPKPKPAGSLGPNVELIPHRPAGSNEKPKGSTDQAYDDFMKEMQGLL
ncbi:WW domain-binding protein 11-like [Paramacrobiotus metropolitanus]|uniref:WW domain-binding protein 11-like n=1 Tax=Paramacrobiotus metropolitanus TaxID=2943436 RepID=UPI002445D016|nr:WW domain-binding protein 11-like [Paramacrobiotus metropolitanus]